MIIQANNQFSQPYRTLALFSGGLDSILAAKLIQEQGIDVICLHFTSPFFGNMNRVAHWRRIHGLHICPVDISEEYVRMLVNRPEHGFGSVMNPCVDCKILMLRHAKKLLHEYDACCVISGEVIGQRPMSQRRDTLNVIRRDSDLKGDLLRPLCALHLEPTNAELSGIIDRTRLLGISGRGRKDQMTLAKRFELKEIPTPGGGCRLAEQENARSYWPVLRFIPNASAVDFHLANTGRQYWHIPDPFPATPYRGILRLIIGRNQLDNTTLMDLAEERDLLFKTRDFPGPVGLGRFHGQEWSEEVVESAASFVASYSSKATRQSQDHDRQIAVRVHPGNLDTPGSVLMVRPGREPAFNWREYTWVEAKESIKGERRTKEHLEKRTHQEEPASTE